MSETPCTCGDSVSVSVECATANAEIVVELSELPVEHAATHNAAGSDPVTVATSQVTGFTAAAAAAAPVQSVAGRTGAVVLAKADVGLANVDNTADASKPVSTAQAAADAAVQAAAVQRANHTGTQLAATISDFAAAVSAAAPPTTDASLLTSGTLADARLSGNVVLTSDSRLADSREWSAATIDQAEAEAGTATTRRAFTALRVFQAIAAWWAGSAAAAKLTGIATGATANATDAQLRDRATHTGTQASTTITGLGGAATLNVGTTAGTVAAGAHVHAAGDITSGTIATARLGSGTASSSTFLRGDQTYAIPAGTTKADSYLFTPSAAPSGATGSAGNWVWALPSGAKVMRIDCRGSGGGGGSGRRGAAGSARCGGGGGGGGGYSQLLVNVSEMPGTTLNVLVGSGGAGGAAPTADNTDGNNGTAGGTVRAQINGGAYLAAATSGSGGTGGTAAATVAGGAGGSVAQHTGIAGSQGRSAAASSNDGQSSSLGSPGGTGGGGVDSSNNHYQGGQGSRSSIVWNWLDPAIGAAGGGNGGSATVTHSSPSVLMAASGAGGGGNNAGGGGSGGNGFYGSGGGGGGGGTNGTTGGAGGNGGDGYVRITVWY